jgi:hypothetical protein
MEYVAKKIPLHLNWSNSTSLNGAGLRSPGIKRLEGTVADSGVGDLAEVDAPQVTHQVTGQVL